jgi:Xaa-Pro aminopeptidase
MLDALPGKKLVYASFEELHKNLAVLLKSIRKVAMQYSPRNAIPYISLADAGTVELVRAMGCKVASSADLVQKFEACWTAAQYQSHLDAGRAIDRITQDCFALAASRVRAKTTLNEYELQQWIVEQFRANAITTEDPPIVAVGPHSGNPHYEPGPGNSSPIREGDLLLLDVWGKLTSAESVYYDITWMGYLGGQVPSKYSSAFEVVRKARDAAVAFVQKSVAAGRRLRGWQVDRAAREVVGKARYGKYFIHRTGHNIGQQVHGNGANMDGWETHDVRRVIPHTCFSIEPGIYLPDFGVRSEVNVFVDAGAARVTGPAQAAILPLLA